MSEVQFLWGDPASGKSQVEFSSIVQAMDQKELVAVSRWVTRDGGDPKMGIMIPRRWENIDSMSWVQACSPLRAEGVP
jgi:ATP-dependent DNA helicase 2 subunit 2